MFEPELVRGSPTRTGGDRSLAGGLQHRAPAQFAEVSDAGRVRRECRRATGVSPRRSIPSPRRGKVRMCRSPGVLTYDWTKNEGQVKEWIKKLEDGRKVKFIYQELPEDGAFITAQLAGNEVVYSVVLAKARNPLGREDVESHFKRELSGK